MQHLWYVDNHSESKFMRTFSERFQQFQSGNKIKFACIEKYKKHSNIIPYGKGWAVSGSPTKKSLSAIYNWEYTRI